MKNSVFFVNLNRHYWQAQVVALFSKRCLVLRSRPDTTLFLDVNLREASEAEIWLLLSNTCLKPMVLCKCRLKSIVGRRQNAVLLDWKIRNTIKKWCTQLGHYNTEITSVHLMGMLQ